MDALDAREVVVKTEPINLSSLIAAVVARYETEAARKEISIHLRIPDGVFANADASYLDLALDNLISNAIKFSPQKRAVHISAIIAGKKVVCEIRDEGPGLTEADQKKLFGKYQKLSARPTGNEISTGLGLSIVKKFVTSMGGEVWCVSEKGKGASFFLAIAHLAN